jgi:hypothetical protein
MRTRPLIALTTAGLAAVVTSAPAAAAAGTGPCPLPFFGPGASYHPTVNGADFTPNVDNPWFPLKVGTTYVYTGTKDGKAAVDRFSPSAATRVIAGVRTRVVQDRLYLDGALAERTTDYYAQDHCGNVWYFGEDTAVLDANGRVTSTDGSFHAGADGAQPGVYMQGRPERGRWFRQEYYATQAEDRYRAVDLSAQVSVPYGSYTSALRTEERTALEPKVVDNKHYVRGVGQVEELAVKGPLEKLVLVRIEP